MPMKSLGAAPSAMMPYRGNQRCLSCALIYELAGSAVGLQRCGKDKQHNTMMMNVTVTVEQKSIGAR